MQDTQKNIETALTILNDVGSIPTSKSWKLDPYAVGSLAAERNVQASIFDVIPLLVATGRADVDMVEFSVGPAGAIGGDLQKDALESLMKYLAPPEVAAGLFVLLGFDPITGLSLVSKVAPQVTNIRLPADADTEIAEEATRQFFKDLKAALVFGGHYVSFEALVDTVTEIVTDLTFEPIRRLVELFVNDFVEQVAIPSGLLTPQNDPHTARLFRVDQALAQRAKTL